MRAPRLLVGLPILAAASLVAVVMLLAPSAQAAAPAADRPAWHALPLTDARTGQSFTLADFAGKTVYLEPMATWCTNCRQQMGIIRDQLRGQLDPDKVVLLGLSVETDLDPATLAQYVDAQGFGWTFAVMTPELLKALADSYGLTITTPPAIPHLVIAPDGATSDLKTGLHTADQLLQELTAAGGM